MPETSLAPQSGCVRICAHPVRSGIRPTLPLLVLLAVIVAGFVYRMPIQCSEYIQNALCLGTVFPHFKYRLWHRAA